MNYCFYLRKHQRHFDEYLHSLQERTNNAVRHSATTVKPSMNIENTLLILNKNSNGSYYRKAIERSKQLYENKAYAHLACSMHLLSMSFRMLQDSWFRKRFYCRTRILKDILYTKYDISQDVGYTQMREERNIEGWQTCEKSGLTHNKIDDESKIGFTHREYAGKPVAKKAKKEDRS